MKNVKSQNKKLAKTIAGADTNRQIVNSWLDASEFESGKFDIIGAASLQKAVTNFAKIIAGKNIPVSFATKGNDSYTDGKTIVLGGKVDKDNFESTIGLALHEGSHILYTDFTILTRLMVKFNVYSTEDYLYLKDILNFVEDRRIDNLVFTSSPGYKQYYHALYSKYFFTPIIATGLKSSSYRCRTWDSYLFRFINILNRATDLNALPGLKEAFEILDITNISRLKTTSDAAEVAYKIFCIFKNHIEEAEQEKEEKETTPGDEDSEAETNVLGSSGSKQGQSESDKELSDKEMTRLVKARLAQEELVRGSLKKKAISKSDAVRINKLTGVDFEIQTVATKTPFETRSIVFKNYTEELAKSRELDILKGMSNNAEFINRGIQLGTILGRKLQVRNNNNDLKYNRLNKGKIDKRMLAGLGYDNINVFEQIVTNAYSPISLHISVDASGSMSTRGFNPETKSFTSAWETTQTSVVAIAKAASMIQGIDVVISYRFDYVKGQYPMPAVLIAYDSKKDKFSKIQRLFSQIQPTDCTPEGLAFEPLSKLIPAGTANHKSYLLNFSDGGPNGTYMGIGKPMHYGGAPAVKHCEGVMKKLRAKGVEILGYYINTSNLSKERSNAWSNFQVMYGKESKWIDVTNIPEVAKTLNAMFLKK